MGDRRTIERAFYKARSEAFEREDPEGSWTWRPSAFEAFRLGYEAAEAKLKQQEPRHD
jgi:hypothetical protein